MNKQILRSAACALLLCATPCAAEGGGTPADTLSLDGILNGEYYAQRVYGVTPGRDGETYTQLADGNTRIVRRSFRTGEETDVVFDAATAQGDAKIARIDGYILSPDEQRVLLMTQRRAIYRRSYTAVFYVYDVATKRYVPLSRGGAQQVPLFSPDGQRVAFARQNNLFVVDLKTGEERQVTTDGERNKILNGVPDWVYEEEFSTNRSFDFSADSRYLAWIRYDETDVPLFSIPMYKGMYPTLEANDEYPGTYLYKYPVAGAKNSTVSVHAYDLQGGAARRMQVPVDTDGYVPRLRFTADASQLAVATLNRHQDRLELYMANPETGSAQLVLREEGNKYIPEAALDALRFFPGGFTLMSDRTGYKHLYLYRQDGTLVRALTGGDYDVTAFYGYDPKTGDTYYQAADESPLRRYVCRTDKRGRTYHLTTEKGTNAATFAAGYKYFMNVFSNTTTPYVTTLRDARGNVITTLLDNAELQERVCPLQGRQEFFTFRTSEGVELNGWMIKPRNFDATRQYPVVMYQYSGPGSQEVRDDWGIGFYGGALFESYLNQMDYIAVVVDGRGTGARGADFEKCTYLRLGQLESRDQVEAARYLGALPYVDSARIAIWGWSFGGFNTLMAMSEGTPAFKCGIAVAAPTNWKYYDTIYTERYMRTPKENAGYADNPISRVDKLSGKLLLVHGTADDNVHYRNCAEWAEAAVQAGKHFQMQVYTNRNHFIQGGNTRKHLFELITDFLKENL